MNTVQVLKSIRLGQLVCLLVQSTCEVTAVELVTNMFRPFYRACGLSGRKYL